VVDCLLKHYEEGWSYRKLASLYGEKEATLRNRMNRAMSLLRRHELAPLHWVDRPKPLKRSRRKHRIREDLVDGFLCEVYPGAEPALNKEATELDEEFMEHELDEDIELGLDEESLELVPLHEEAAELEPDEECATFSAHPSPSYGGSFWQRVLSWLKGEPPQVQEPKTETLMMKKPKKPESRDVTILLDRSSSMEPLRGQVVKSLNQFLTEQEEMRGACTLSMVQFNHRAQKCWDGLPVDEVPLLEPEDYIPHGYTALYDTVYATIRRTRERLSKLAKPNRPGRVLIAILTDGLDTASRKYTAKDVLEQVDLMQNQHGWEFLFLAAGREALREAASIGIDRDCSYAFDASAEGIEQSIQVLSAATRRKLRR
jgi:hypothetical protein